MSYKVLSDRLAINLHAIIILFSQLCEHEEKEFKKKKMHRNSIGKSEIME